VCYDISGEYLADPWEERQGFIERGMKVVVVAEKDVAGATQNQRISPYFRRVLTWLPQIRVVVSVF
jgi:hypothetical protein